MNAINDLSTTKQYYDGLQHVGKQDEERNPAPLCSVSAVTICKAETSQKVAVLSSLLGQANSSLFSDYFLLANRS